MAEFRIPDDIDNAIVAMTGAGQLLTAHEWERSAIVYAFTAPGGPRNTPHHHPEPPRVTLGTFARLGIKGLTTIKAVRRYRRIWEWGMEQEICPEVNPGDLVIMPDEPFPGWNEVLPEYQHPYPPQPATVMEASHELFERLRGIRDRFENMIVWLRRRQLDSEQREEAREYLRDFTDLLERLSAAVEGKDLSPEELAATHERWGLIGREYEE